MFVQDLNDTIHKLPRKQKKKRTKYRKALCEYTIKLIRQYKSLPSVSAEQIWMFTPPAK